MPRGSRSSTRASARRRPLFVLALVIVTVLVFLGKLTSVQVVHADALDTQSKDNRSTTETLYGGRGEITDASGTVLAQTVMRYRVTASPVLAAESGELTADATAIAKALGVDHSTVEHALTANPKSNYAVVATEVTLAGLDRVKALDVPWLYFVETPKRIYPSGAVAGNLIGFVGAQNQPQAGLEYSQNTCLAGQDGTESYESAPDGTAIPGTETTTKEAKQGGTVQLTINRDLQWYAQQVLAARAKQTGASWGTVVVEQVKTGKLLAVADYPTVDPNNVNATASSDTAALGSRAFTAPFEPGSTFKSVTTAALLDKGLITPTTHVVAPYRLITKSGANVNDSEVHADWDLTTTGVLIQSSNTGMSKLSMRMSDATRYAYLKKFGFGTSTAVDFGAEAAGDLGADAPNWDAQSELATTFGQGLTTTSVQMASAYATLANGGVKLPVSLVSSCTSASGKVTEVPKATGTRVVSKKAADETVEMLENVATQGWLAQYVKIPGYRVAIKTGTAQESDGNGGYSSEFLVSVVGVAPANDPQYVVYVNLDSPTKMNTSQATAPIFQKVMARVLQEEAVAPSGSKSPYLPEYY